MEPDHSFDKATLISDKIKRNPEAVNNFRTRVLKSETSVRTRSHELLDQRFFTPERREIEEKLRNNELARNILSKVSDAKDEQEEDERRKKYLELYDERGALFKSSIDAPRVIPQTPGELAWMTLLPAENPYAMDKISPWGIRIDNTRRIGYGVRGGPQVVSDEQGRIWISPQDENGEFAEIKKIGPDGVPEDYSIEPLKVEARPVGAEADLPGQSITFAAASHYEITEGHETYSLYIVRDTFTPDGKLVYRGSSSQQLKAESPDLVEIDTEGEAGIKKHSGVVIKCGNGDAVFYPFDTLRTQAPAMRKPILYFYPYKKMAITVTLAYDGRIISEYPKSDNGVWKISADKNSVIEYKNRKFKYIFWEGIPYETTDWNLSHGFCVKRNDLELFLEEKLSILGLNFSEKNDFITYWLPILEQNTWSLIAFNPQQYLKIAKLKIFPKPDQLIRIFMVFKGLSHEINLPQQNLKNVKRKGFTVVEWGGSNLDELQISKVEKNFIGPQVFLGANQN